MDCLVSPPQPGDESYDTFIKVSEASDSVLIIVSFNLMKLACVSSWKLLFQVICGKKVE